MKVAQVISIGDLKRASSASKYRHRRASIITHLGRQQVDNREGVPEGHDELLAEQVDQAGQDRAVLALDYDLALEQDRGDQLG
jgi:hypothetical protein